MMDYLKEAEKRFDDMVAVRRELHRNPEIGLLEFHTAQVIERELDRFGIPHSRVGATGILGVIGKGKNPVVALRADIDALPVEEKTGLSYSSEKKGIMHACGHDLHTAALLGAAGMLAEYREKLKCEVRLIFQPAEEIGKGAKDFTQQGMMNGVSRVYGIHTAPDLPCGTVGIKPGVNNASVDHFTIRIRGKASHVCAPEKGVDALYIASQLVVSLQALVTRRISPVTPSLIGIGKMSAGTAYNVVAEDAVIEGTTRNVNEEERAKMNQRISETADRIAAIYGGTAQTEWEEFTPVLTNDETACHDAERIIRHLFEVHEKSHDNWEQMAIKTDRELYMSGDNFAEFQKYAKGAYLYVGTSNRKLPETHHPYHSNYFQVDERALIYGAAYYAALAAECGVDMSDVDKL